MNTFNGCERPCDSVMLKKNKQKQKSILDCPAKLQILRLFLQIYGIRVRYKKGKEMYIADLLSRMAKEKPKLCLLAEDEVYLYHIEQKMEETKVNLEIKETKMEELQNWTSHSWRSQNTLRKAGLLQRTSKVRQ
jgi:hypothetical protein